MYEQTTKIVPHKSWLATYKVRFLCSFCLLQFLGFHVDVTIFILTGLLNRGSTWDGIQFRTWNSDGYRNKEAFPLSTLLRSQRVFWEKNQSVFIVVYCVCMRAVRVRAMRIDVCFLIDIFTFRMGKLVTMAATPSLVDPHKAYAPSFVGSKKLTGTIPFLPISFRALYQNSCCSVNTKISLSQKDSRNWLLHTAWRSISCHQHWMEDPIELPANWRQIQWLWF